MGQSFNLTVPNTNPVNLVQYPNYNASTWTLPLGFATLTTGIDAPDGSLDAVRMTCSSAGSTILRVLFNSFTPNGIDPYTVSFWVRLYAGSTTTGSGCALFGGVPALVYDSKLILGKWVNISITDIPTATTKTFFDLLSNATTDYYLDFWGLTITSVAKVDISSAYVTKEYLIENYPNLAPSMVTPALWLWGSNAYGQLGDNTTVHKSSPVQTISGGANWKQVSSGGTFTSATKTDGTLWLWGSNAYGQLGINNTTVHKSSPVQTTAGGNTWINIACGYSYTAAIKTDGTLWTWGRNNYGQLGDNTIVNKSSPDQISGGGNTWKYVSCGDFHTSAIKTDGTLWTWGSNAYGQLGLNNTTSRSHPVQVVGGGTNWKQVSCGVSYTAAIKTDGTLWTWGFNAYGQLGDNTIVNKSSPVQISGGGTNWKQVSCGVSYTAAIKTDGTLWTWGSNAYGQLGDNTIVNKSTPVQTIAGGTNWKQVSCGSRGGIAAIKTDGTLWTWGRNNFGQLGDNTIVNKSTPVQTIAGGTNWKQVSSGWMHVVAISETSGW